MDERERMRARKRERESGMHFNLIRFDYLIGLSTAETSNVRRCAFENKTDTYVVLLKILTATHLIDCVHSDVTRISSSCFPLSESVYQKFMFRVRSLLFIRRINMYTVGSVE